MSTDDTPDLTKGIAMKFPRSLTLASLLFASALAGPVCAQESIETFGGAWDTAWGELWAMPSVSGYNGTYEEDNGRFTLEFTGHFYEGVWAEDMSDHRCAVPMLGSYYWGRLELGNSASFPGFQMLWGYCDTGRVDKVWAFHERLPDGM
ncbi:MAG: hypothetical protein ACRBCL_02715 [Maritimibacter sp.]